MYGVIFFSRGRGNIFKHGFYLLVLTEKSGMKSVIVMEHVNTDNSDRSWSYSYIVGHIVT